VPPIFFRSGKFRNTVSFTFWKSSYGILRSACRHGTAMDAAEAAGKNPEMNVKRQVRMWDYNPTKRVWKYARHPELAERLRQPP